jgi:hypothetical protein
MKTETINELDFFENTSIKLIDNKVYASRTQLQELYGASKTAIQENIIKLKNEGLINGSEIRPNSGKPYEVYNLKEVLSIGMRLNTERAIKFQLWAVESLEKIILNQVEEIKRAQLMESIAWNHLDAKDNYRR